MQNINKKTILFAHKAAFVLLLLATSNLFAALDHDQAKTINGNTIYPETPQVILQNNNTTAPLQPEDSSSTVPSTPSNTMPGFPDHRAPTSGNVINGTKQDSNKIILPAPSPNNNPPALNNQWPEPPQVPGNQPNSNNPTSPTSPGAVNQSIPTTSSRVINNQSRVLNINSLSVQLPIPAVTTATKTAIPNISSMPNGTPGALSPENIAPTIQNQKTALATANQTENASDVENEAAEYINPRIPAGRQIYFSDYQNFLPQELISIQENYKNFNAYYKKLAHQRSKDIKIKLTGDSEKIRFMLQNIESRDNLEKIKQLPTEIKNTAMQQMADYRLLDIATKTAIASFVVKGDQSLIANNTKAKDYMQKNKVGMAKFFSRHHSKDKTPTPINSKSQPTSSSATPPAQMPNTPMSSTEPMLNAPASSAVPNTPMSSTMPVLNTPMSSTEPTTSTVPMLNAPASSAVPNTPMLAPNLTNSATMPSAPSMPPGAVNNNTTQTPIQSESPANNLPPIGMQPQLSK